MEKDRVLEWYRTGGDGGWRKDHRSQKQWLQLWWFDLGEREREGRERPSKQEGEERMEGKWETDLDGWLV